MIVGLDHINGIQAARILAARNVPVIGVGQDRAHYCCRTRVCQEIVFSDAPGSSALVETLERLGASLGQRGVLFPSTDMHVLTISHHRDQLAPWFHIALPPHDVVEMLMDKTRFYTFARETALPIPRTILLHSGADAAEAARELTFPCVLKPPLSAAPKWESTAQRKAYVLSTPPAFLAAYERLARLAPALIAQEWIPGPSTNLYSCNCYVDARSSPVATFVSRKIRQWPPETGETCLGEECRNDEVLRTTVKLFSSIPYRGLGYLEMKQDVRTGAHSIVEPNVGRPTGRCALAEAAGVELLLTMYRDAQGLPLPSPRLQRHTGVKWIHMRRDFQSAVHDARIGRLTLRGWWESVRGRKVDALFSWSDPWPFFADLSRAVRLFLSKEERRMRRIGRGIV